MTVHSTRLFGPTPLSNAAWTLLYTCPADRTAVLRALVLTNANQATAQSGSLGIGGAGAQKILCQFTLQINTAPLVIPDLVLNPGDQLWGTIAGSGANNGVNVTGTGSRLLGAAPA